MVRIRSLADYMADWRRLLNLLAANVKDGLIPDMPVLRSALENALVRLEQTSAQQDAIRAESKDNAEESRALVRTGSDMALQLRAAIRAHLGPRNPMLTEFRVRMLAPRRPKPTAPEEKAEPAARRRGRRAKAEPEPEAEPKEPEPAAS
jgi:hypothetical protein